MTKKASSRSRAISASQATQLLESLEDVATKIGIEVRYDILAAGPVHITSGACRMRDKNLVVVDRRLPVQEKLAALAKELAEFNLDEVYLTPAVREYVELFKNGGRQQQ